MRFRIGLCKLGRYMFVDDKKLSKILIPILIVIIIVGTSVSFVKNQ